MTPTPRDVVLVHGFADQVEVWSSERHARGVVHHTLTIGVRHLGFVAWVNSLDVTPLDAATASTLHAVE